MTLLAALIVLLVFGPLLILVPTLLILCATGLLSNDGPRVVRKAFRCPVKRRMVTVDFVVPAGAARPSSLVSCSAFSDPKRVTCAKRCVHFAEVHWTPPIGAFAQWSLTAGGVVTPNGSHGPAPEPAVPAAA